MFTTWKLTIASIKMFVRNRQAIFFTFVTPLIIMLIFGAIGFDRAPQVDVGIAVQGSINPQTRTFVDQLKEIPIFKLTYGTEQAQRAALERGDRAIVLVINDYPQKLTLLQNTGDVQSQTALSIINQMIDKVTIASHNISPVVNLDVQEVNAHNLKYIDFLLPGLVALSIMQLSVFSVAFVFVDFKEKGILKRIIATPVKPYQFVVANIITRLIVAVVQAAFFIAIGVIFFNVQVVGSYVLMLLIVILGAIMFLGLGFLISGVAKTTDAVPALANLIVFPMIFISGVFFDVNNMPQWLQYIAKILPLTYFADALRQVMNRGARVPDIAIDILVIVAWSAILVFLAILTFRFEEKRGA